MTLIDSMSITTGELLLEGTGTFGGAAVASAQGGQTPPVLGVRDSSSVAIALNFTIRESAILTVGALNSEESPVVSLAGHFRNESIYSAGFNWFSGKLILNGTGGCDTGTCDAGINVGETCVDDLDCGQKIEVAGIDYGPRSFGFHTGLDRNFSLPTIEVVVGSTVIFTNEVLNATAPGAGSVVSGTAAQLSGGVAGIDPCIEALYADTLIAGGTVAAGATVYYVLLTDPDGNVIAIACEGLVPLPQCDVSADCDDTLFCTGIETCIDIAGEITTSGCTPSPCGICEPAQSPCIEGELCDEDVDGCVPDCPLLEPVVAEPTPVDKNRFVTFWFPTSIVGMDTAIRVKLTTMYDEGVCAPRSGEQTDLSAFNDEIRWVGPPQSWPEASNPDPDRFAGAELQCSPYFTDWLTALSDLDGDSFDVLHVFGKAILPCSQYEVQLVDLCCAEALDNPGCFSTALTISTALWADIWSPYGDVSFTDIGKMVDKFKSIPYNPGPPEEGAPPKVRAMLRGNVPPLNLSLNFTDIGRVVDGFKTIAYPELGPGVEICDDGIDNNCNGAIDEDGELCEGCPWGVSTASATRELV